MSGLSGQTGTKPPPIAPNVRFGILFMLAAMLAFTLMDALSKQLVITQAPLQVVWGIYVIQAAVLLLTQARHLPTVLRTQRPGLQILRAVFLTATSVCFVTGLQFVPLAEAGALVMFSPLAFTALAVPFLGERVGIQRWTCVLTGLLGAMIIMRPGSDAMQTAALLPLAAAVLHAFYQVATRFVAKDDGVRTTLTYSVLCCALIMSPLMPFIWVPLTPEVWACLTVAAVAGLLAEYALIESLARAPAAVVAPYTYSYLLWTALAGWLAFGERPDAWAFTGAGVIVVSGLYVWHRERLER